MSVENSAYNGALFQGEPYVFPVMGVPHDNRGDYYRDASQLDRSMAEYEQAFGFDFNIFAGKRILDLGAGTEDRFGRQAREQGLLVVSVNPNWKIQQNRTSRPQEYEMQGDGSELAAIAQELPFADESFDVVLSLWGVPAYLPGTKSEYKRSFSEINRVLAPSGVAIMFPIPRVSLAQPAFKEVLDASFSNYRLLDENGIPKLFVIKNELPEEHDRNEYLAASMDRHTDAFIW